LRSLLSRRAVLVTGKGGVGKSTLAAALARMGALQGKRTLIAEITSDAFAPSPVAQALGGDQTGEEPRPIAGGIRGVKLTPSMGHHRFLEDTLPVRLLADAAMRSTALRRFLGAAPAFTEMGVLYRALDLLRQRRPDGTPEHELLIVDCPATGHALALTQLPEIILRIIPGGPIGRAVREGLALFTDPQSTSALVVTLPESLPVSESLELVEGLIRHRVPVAGMVVNRMPSDPFSEEERTQVDRLNAEAGPLFGTRAIRRIDRARAACDRLQSSTPLPLYRVPEIDENGPALVEAIARALA
jgi:anion-transporting  ArsA/GET3 family ATPase